MGMGSNVRKELTEWGILAMVIVVISVVLLQFREVDTVTAGLNTTINTFVTGLSEPQNWVIIVVVGIVGFALVKLFSSKGN